MTLPLAANCLDQERACCSNNFCWKSLFSPIYQLLLTLPVTSKIKLNNVRAFVWLVVFTTFLQKLLQNIVAVGGKVNFTLNLFLNALNTFSM